MLLNLNQTKKNLRTNDFNMQGCINKYTYLYVLIRTSVLIIVFLILKSNKRICGYM